MRDALALFAVLFICFFGIKSCQESDWYKESERKRIAQEKLNATPHVIREADGCKVYAFYSGDRYHYFTRCSSSTNTTESSYSVSCGKGCSKTEVETIEVKHD